MIDLFSKKFLHSIGQATMFFKFKKGFEETFKIYTRTQ